MSETESGKMVDSTVLERAKEKQRELAHATTIVIRLDLFEDMIREIERLQHQVDVLRQEHPAHKLRAVRVAAESQEK